MTDNVDIGLDAVQTDRFRTDHDPERGRRNACLRAIYVVGAVPAVEQNLTDAERRLPAILPCVVDCGTEPLRPVDPLLADVGVELELGKKAALGLLETVFGCTAICLGGVDPGVRQHRLLDRFAKRSRLRINSRSRQKNGGRC
jgi:hypothetical protein